MKTFHNSRIVIIGSSVGIGYHCAQQFALHGARLVLVARGEERLQKVAEQLPEVVSFTKNGMIV